MSDFSAQRVEMVEHQLKPRGITDKATLEAMSKVPREEFILKKMRSCAYEDGPLPIEEGQTISQPYIVALMTEAATLNPDDKVLDVGTGSGYAAAVLSRIVNTVYTVERIAPLAKSAKRVFQKLGYENIYTKVSDGTMGWKEHAPYDAIITTAGAPKVPQSLLQQLKKGGRLIIPVGDAVGQKLLRITRIANDQYDYEELEHVRFVPLIGKQGWPH